MKQTNPSSGSKSKQFSPLPAAPSTMNTPELTDLPVLPSSTPLPKQADNVAYSPFAIAYNHHSIEYCRTSMSALAGSTAGIIGLTSLQGFAFYLAMVGVLWALLMGKVGANHGKYFTSKYHVITNGFLGGLTTYVLFWTFLYGMVHVY